MWSATSHAVKERQSLQNEINTDVVIVGGGFTGLATAYFLRKKGIGAVVLEKNCVGWGASGRNAGILTPGYKNNFFSMTKRLGESGTKEMMDISVKAIQMLVEIVNTHRIECSLEHNGHLSAAFKPSHFQQLREKQKYMLEKLNYETYLISRQELNGELNSSSYHGALLDPNGYIFHPLNYALGLAEVVESLGGEIYENTNVIKIDETQHKVIAHTERGKVVANHLVVATNGYTTGITKGLRRSLISIGSYMIATEPLPEELKNHLLPKNRSVTDTKNMLYYFRFSADNRFLFGGRVSFKESNRNQNDDKFYQTLHTNMREVFPELAQFRVEFAWGGLTAFTRDFYPQIGNLSDKIHFALGYCGRGASLSTFMGWLLSENIIDRGREKSVLERLPLKQIPFYGVSAKLVNVAGLYYRLLDVIS